MIHRAWSPAGRYFSLSLSERRKWAESGPRREDRLVERQLSRRKLKTRLAPQKTKSFVVVSSALTES